MNNLIVGVVMLVGIMGLLTGSQKQENTVEGIQVEEKGEYVVYGTRMFVENGIVISDAKNQNHIKAFGCDTGKGTYGRFRLEKRGGGIYCRSFSPILVEKKRDKVKVVRRTIDGIDVLTEGGELVQFNNGWRPAQD